LSDYCDVPDSFIQEKIQLRETVVEKIKETVALQDPSEQVVTGWVNSLGEISSQPNQISSRAFSSLLDIAELALSSVDSEGYSASEVLSSFLGGLDSLSNAVAYWNLTSSTSSSSSQQGRRALSTSQDSLLVSGRILGHLRNYSSLVLREMVPGQDASEKIQTNFRIFLRQLEVTNHDGSTKRRLIGESDSSSSCSSESFEMPQSMVEQTLQQQPTSFSVPTCPNQSTSSLSISAISLSSSLFVSGHSFRSNPIDITFPSSSSSSSSAGKLVLSMGSDNQGMGTVIASVNRTVQCTAGDYSNHSVACPNQLNYSVPCRGRGEQLLFRCPAYSLLPSCQPIDALGNVLGDSQCSVIYSGQNISCVCPVSVSSASSSSSSSSAPTVHVTYVSLLRGVETSFTTTVLSVDDLNGNLVAHSWEAIITIGILLASIVVGMSLAWHADQRGKKKISTEEKVIEHAKVHSLYALKLKQTSRRSLNYQTKQQQEDQEEERKQNNRYLLQLASESLPTILLRRTFQQKVWEEEKRFHRWLGIIYHYSSAFPRILRVVSLASNIVIMLFIQSLTYDYTHGDDGTCATFKNEQSCLAPKSSYGTGGSQCYWTPPAPADGGGSSSQGSCGYVEPDSSLEIVIFVAIFSGLVSAPLAISIDWVLHNILSAPDIPSIADLQLPGTRPGRSHGPAAPISPKNHHSSNELENGEENDRFSYLNPFTSSAHSQQQQTHKQSILNRRKRVSTSIQLKNSRFAAQIEKDFQNLLEELLNYRNSVDDLAHKQELNGKEVHHPFYFSLDLKYYLD
jgi:hypothetical protein